MSTADGTEPLDDSEVLYRRVPVLRGWYTADLTPSLSPEAFGPRDDEPEGISLARAKHRTRDEAAQGPSKKGYYVAAASVGDLLAAGACLDPDALGHVSVTNLNTTNRDTPEAEELKLRLAEKFGSDVTGPHAPTPS